MNYYRAPLFFLALLAVLEYGNFNVASAHDRNPPPSTTPQPSPLVTVHKKKRVNLFVPFLVVAGGAWCLFTCDNDEPAKEAPPPDPGTQLSLTPGNLSDRPQLVLW